ncbi:hypothetical protein HOLleu_42185 [Holothuria leucospilota]|uniref:Uncharacterized protein n=1 Tax=Holothuria leucospilota TaxID=206669 RepID=A0A9Q0YFQ3_HOLLE|nr:hypothetical protein HOLleu_42185 [Holothuria leucospilota]
MQETVMSAYVSLFFQNLSLENMLSVPTFDVNVISSMEVLAVEVQKCNRKTNAGVAGGSAAGMVSGGLTIAGAALIPATAGVSTALMALGIALGVTAGAVNVGVSVNKAVKDRKSKNSVKNDLERLIEFHEKLYASLAFMFRAKNTNKILSRVLNDDHMGKPCMPVKDFRMIQKQMQIENDFSKGSVFDVVQEVERKCELLQQLLDAVVKALDTVFLVDDVFPKKQDNPIIDFLIYLPVISRFPSDRHTYLHIAKQYLELDKGGNDLAVAAVAGAGAATNLAMRSGALGTKVAFNIASVSFTFDFLLKIRHIYAIVCCLNG